MAFTTDCVPYRSADGCDLLVPLLGDGFPYHSHAVFLSGWQQLAHSLARQWLSWFARRFAQHMTAHCSFFCSLMAFTVCTLFCSVDGSAFLVLTLVNGFPCFRAVLLSGWQQIAHSSARQRLSRFTRRFSQQMAADCSFVHSSMAFTTVYVPCCPADGRALLILSLVNSFDGLPAILLCGW